MSEQPPIAAEARPGLFARALRPPVVRLRRSAAITLVLAASTLVAGALTWSFVVAPQVRAAQRQAAQEKEPDAGASQARPSEVITSQPASYDRLPEPRVLAGKPPKTSPPSSPAPRAAPRPPRDLEFDEARTAGLLFTTQARTAARSPSPAPDEARMAATEPARPTFGLKAGTLIPARLLSAIDTSRPGPVIAVVSSAVFDTERGRQILIPQGARLVGRHEGASRYGDRRAFLVWEQLLLPNGVSVVLNGAPGIDAQGASGVEGQVNRRLGQLSIATLLSGAITTLGQAARNKDDDEGGLLLDVGDASAIEAARIGGKLVDRELQVSPSIRLEHGAPVQVLLTKDLVLQAWEEQAP